MSDGGVPVDEHTTMLNFGLGIIGVGLLRGWLDPAVANARLAEIRFVLAMMDADETAMRVRPMPHDTVDGYSAWAANYDKPGNPLIDAEQPVVHGIVRPLPAGRALDAACGTGRHAAFLASQGWDVVGVDTTPAMLDVARTKLPDAELHVGDLHALPLDDASVDLTVCALALCHIEPLEPAVAELARVTRPGGHVVLSDMHPFFSILGGTAAFRSADEAEFPFVRDHHHSISSWLASFRAAGLEVVDCIEPTFDDHIDTMAPEPLRPAMRQGFRDAPWAIVWHLRRADGRRAGQRVRG
jgi:ubiquinone/menaquinone biosynthesis C-methylase UbiE